MSKKLFVLFAIAAFVCSFANVAFAINRVEVKVVSEPITRGATCDKAGSFSLAWDASSILTHGDVITIDLDEGAVLCRDINILITPTDDTRLYYTGTAPGADQDANTWYVDAGQGWRDTTGLGVFNFPDEKLFPNSISPVSYYEDVDGSNLPLAIAESLVFRLMGSKGSDRVTLRIIGETNSSQLTVGPDPLDTFTLRFFDQKVNSTSTENAVKFNPPVNVAPGGADGIWIDVEANNLNELVYETIATVADNTLCIDISDLPDTVNKVQANIDSSDDKFSFIPSNPQIAHIRGAMNIVFDPCKNETCGNITIGAQIDQGVSTCSSFDNETGDGYCANTHRDNKKVIYSSNPYSNLVNLGDENLIVTAEIMVDGQTGDNGVYWANNGLNAGGYDASQKTNCTYDAAFAVAMDVYYNAAGTSSATDNTIEPAAVNVGCAIPTNNRVTKFMSQQTNLGLETGDTYLYLNLPSFNYDLNVIGNGGQNVTVEITISKYPCGELFRGETCIGTFGCDDPDVYNPILFPYFAPAESSTYTNGIVVNNLGNAAGNITLFWYEQDGDAFQIDVADYNGETSLMAKGIYMNTLAGIMDTETATRIAGSGTLGDSRCYVVACTNFTADGFALVFRTDNGVSTGYLPRVDFVNDANDSVNQVINVCTTIGQ